MRRPCGRRRRRRKWRKATLLCTIHACERRLPKQARDWWRRNRSLAGRSHKSSREIFWDLWWEILLLLSSTSCSADCVPGRRCSVILPPALWWRTRSTLGHSEHLPRLIHALQRWERILPEHLCWCSPTPYTTGKCTGQRPLCFSGCFPVAAWSVVADLECCCWQSCN